MKKDRKNQRRLTSNAVVRFFFLLREYISPRTSSTVVRVQVVGVCGGTHVGGHARTRYRVEPGLRLPIRKKENVEETLQSFAASTELECERQE